MLINQTHYQPNIAMWDHILTQIAYVPNVNKLDTLSTYIAMWDHKLTQIIVVPKVNQLPSPLWQLSIICVPHMFSKKHIWPLVPIHLFSVFPLFSFLSELCGMYLCCVYLYNTSHVEFSWMLCVDPILCIVISHLHCIACVTIWESEEDAWLQSSLIPKVGHEVQLTSNRESRYSRGTEMALHPDNYLLIEIPPLGSS